jgi:hypothetical protein
MSIDSGMLRQRPKIGVATSIEAVLGINEFRFMNLSNGARIRKPAS